MSDSSSIPEPASGELASLPEPLDESTDSTAASGIVRQAILIYFISAFIVLAPISLFFDYLLSLHLDVVGLGLAIGALWLAVVLALYRRFPPQTAVSVALGIWAALTFAFTLAYTALGFFEPVGYGDRVCSILFLDTRLIFERWFLGTAIWNWVYAAIWAHPLSPRFFPEGLATVEACIRMTGATVMLASAAILLGRWGKRMSIVLPLLSPIWILLAAGYVEYYPMIAGLFLGFLVYAFELPGGLAARTPLSAGIWIALLPLAYVAYAPLALLLLVFYALARPRELDKMLGFFLVACVVLVGCCYPKPIAEFFPELYKNMLWGKTDTYPAYWNHELFAGSNFFDPVFALSPTHLSDLLYMWFYGGGLIFPLLLLFFAYRARPRTRQQVRALLINRGFLFAVLLLGWELLYFIFYIARLGPLGDIDLFFATFLTVAYFAGYLLDRLVERGDLRAETLPLIVAACAGNSCICVVYLFAIGLPPPL